MLVLILRVCYAVRKWDHRGASLFRPLRPRPRRDTYGDCV